MNSSVKPLNLLSLMSPHKSIFPVPPNFPNDETDSVFPSNYNFPDVCIPNGFNVEDGVSREHLVRRTPKGESVPYYDMEDAPQQGHFLRLIRTLEGVDVTVPYYEMEDAPTYYRLWVNDKNSKELLAAYYEDDKPPRGRWIHKRPDGSRWVDEQEFDAQDVIGYDK